MIHKLHDKKEIARKKRIVRNIIGFGLFVLLAFLGVFASFGKIFMSIGKPVWKAQNVIVDDATNALVAVRTKRSVYNENQQLLQENSRLKNAMIDYSILEKENTQLKELIGRLPTERAFILATILTKPNRSPYDTIIIDGGARAGMVAGQHVYADAKIPIGEINKVYPTLALVMLYSNPGQTVEAILEGSNASVELLGRGGGNFEMSIPIDIPSEKGSLVVLPNLSSEVVAIVDGVISAPTDPLKKVILHSPINIQSLKWVHVQK